MKRDMSIKILLNRNFIFFVAVICLLSPHLAWAQQNNKHAHTSNFEAQVTTLEKNNSELLGKIRVLQRTQKDLENQINKLEEKRKKEKSEEVEGKELLNAFLSPIRGLWRFFLRALLCLLPVCLVLLLLWLISFRKEFFKKWLIPVLVIFAVLFVFSVLPLFAGETPKKQSIEDKLQTAYKIYTKGAVDKAILLLEEKPFHTLRIPEIKMPSTLNYLKPFYTVQVGTPEYHYTLGCLYLLKDQGGKAESEFGQVYSSIPRGLSDEERKRYSFMQLSIMRYFIEGKESPDRVKAGQVLKRALPFISNIDDILRIHDYLQKHEMTESAGETLKRAQSVAKSLDDKLKWTDFLLREDPEEAQKYLDKIIKSYTTKDLLKISDFCIKNRLYPTAYSALNKIVSDYYYSCPRTGEFVAVITNVRLPFPSVLPPTVKRPPTTSKEISLPVLFGIISELDKKDDMAEEAYKYAVEADINQVISSAGTYIPTNLNDLFYLKQFWEKKDYKDKLAKLNPFYGLVKENYQKKYIQNLAEVKEKNLHTKYSIEKNIAKLKTRKFHLEMSILFRNLRKLAAIIVALGMIAFSLIDAWQHTVKIERFRAFAFLGKFIEDIGWCQCFTILFIPLGILNILMGQFMWILLDMHRQGRRIFQGASMEAPSE